jgi:hypothetical protein
VSGKGNGVTPPKQLPAVTATEGDPLDGLDQAITQLENTDWTEEEPVTGEILLDAIKAGAAIAAEATGKHQALQDARRASIPDSDPPSSGPPTKEKFFLKVLESIEPKWLRAPVVVIVVVLLFALVVSGSLKLAGFLH